MDHKIVTVVLYKFTMAAAVVLFRFHTSYNLFLQIRHGFTFLDFTEFAKNGCWYVFSLLGNQRVA